MSTRIPGKPSRPLAYVVIAIIGGVFLIPLLAMLEFTLRQTTGGYGLDNWAALFDPENSRKYRTLFQGIGNSFLLAALTLGIVLVVFFPTIVLVHLRFPKLERALDLLTVLPIAVPAIVLVVGFAPIYRIIGQTFGSGIWSLSLAYGVLVLPFTYRAIVAELQGMDARTLAEAGRSLGASWGTVLVRIIAPGVRRGLLAGSLLTIAIVLGEFTVSSLLNRTTLQVALLQVSKSDPFVAVIVSLLSLVGVFLVLLVVSSTGGPPKRRSKKRRGGSATDSGSPALASAGIAAPGLAAAPVVGAPAASGAAAASADLTNVPAKEA